MQSLTASSKKTRFNEWRAAGLILLAVVSGCGAHVSPSSGGFESTPREVDGGHVAPIVPRQATASDPAIAGVSPASRSVEVRPWSDAPSRCSGKVGNVIRPETAYSTVLFLRYIWSRVQGIGTAGSRDELDWLLHEVTAKPRDEKFLVVPEGYGAGWTSGQVTERLVEAMTQPFERGGNAYVAQVTLTGAINDGGVEAPMLGIVSVRLYYDRSDYVGRFGGSARFCIVPQPGRGPHVFIEPGVEF